MLRWVISQLPGYEYPNLTKMELESIAKAAGMKEDGNFSRGLKIVSCTTYSASGFPVMMNTYSSWTDTLMNGEKYYRGVFSNDTTPMWR